jgi:hypothetical protein
MSSLSAIRSALLCAGLLAGAVLTPALVSAATYDEAVSGDLSGNRLAPSFLQLDFTPAGNTPGSNVVAGTVGRVAGVVDRDYLHVNIPSGYVLARLLVGNQTTVGGAPGGAAGSFIGIAAGSMMPVAETAADAQGLLGFRVYTLAERGTDILDDMAMASQGASGFSVPLGAGDYTLWIQELATGSYTYRFNLVLEAAPAVVPLPPAAALFAGGLGLLGWRASRAQRA